MSAQQPKVFNKLTGEYSDVTLAATSIMFNNNKTYQQAYNDGDLTGPQGIQGEKGDTPTFQTYVTVTTLPEGNNATASLKRTGDNYGLSLNIPKGNTGATGPAPVLLESVNVSTLEEGSNATASLSETTNDVYQLSLGIPAGVTPTFNTYVTVTTLPEGSAATASLTKDGNTYSLSLNIPKGDSGSDATVNPDNAMSDESTNVVQNSVVKSYVDTGLSSKVDKISGKELSTNDFTDELKTKLEDIEEGATNVIVDDSIVENSTNPVQSSVIKNYVDTALDDKVDKVSNKGLSTNDLTDELLTKLNGIEEGATFITVDNAMSTVSTNPVQNHIVKNYIDMGLSNKVDTVIGKDLSSNDFTNELKTKLEGIENGATNIVVDGSMVENSTNPVQSTVIKNYVDTALSNKVNKEESKGLSSNDFTDELLAKLNGIQEGATFITVDNTMSTISMNPVQNRIVKSYIDTTVAGLVNSAPDALDTLKELSDALGGDANFATTMTNQLASKVDKTEGKGLSSNDFTDNLKTKLEGIETGAQVNTVLSVNGATGTIVLTHTDVGAAAAEHGNHVPSTETPSNIRFLRNDNTWADVTPANIGAATSDHVHSQYVEKEDGKGLTSNDLTNTLLNKLNGVEEGAQVNTVTSVNSQTGDVSLTYGDVGAAAATHTHNYVPIEEGKGLSSNDFTDALLNKLNSVEEGATFITVDNTMSTVSSNPVQNRVVKNYIDVTVANLVDSAPEALNTLNELSAALGNDANFATTISTQLGSKANSSAAINNITVNGTTVTYTMGNGDTYSFITQDTTYNTATATEKGIVFLYDNTGTSTTGTLTQAAITTALSNKVSTETGKGLSSNDYTTAEKTKLTGIEDGAQVNTVTSVNGNTGAVSLSYTDVGAAASNHIHNYVSSVTAANGIISVTSAQGTETIQTGSSYTAGTGISIVNNEISCTAEVKGSSTAPTAVTGAIWFDIDEQVIKFYNGTAWVKFGAAYK